ncbi:MAG: GGDEF domain-containing protein [Coriobacteriales bacterium]|nr:GGDEF domain-containing protein [Coriobacteriales bacterium]
MKLPIRKRTGVSLVFFAALVVLLAYLANHPYKLGVPTPSPREDLSMEEGWTTEDGTPVDLGDLRSIPGFAQNGATITTHLPSGIPSQAELNFVSRNLTLHLFYGDEEVYAFDPAREPSDKPYATHFNFAPLSPTDSGKVARLVVRPVYADMSPRLTDVRITETSTYIQDYVKAHGFALMESLVTIFIGISVIVFNIALRKIDHGQTDLFALGSAIIFMGMWSAAVTNVLQLIGVNAAVASTLEYLSLLFVPYPIVCFAGSLILPRNRKRFNFVARVIAVGCIALTAFLCVGCGANMHEALPISHAQLLSCAAIVTVEVIAAVREKARSDIREELASHNAMLIAFLVFMACAMADFVVFTVSKHGVSDSAFFVRHGLFVFAAVLAMEAARASLMYIDRAAYADKVEVIAYTDSLTNIGNRTAWKIMRDEVEVALANGTLQDVAICQLDVNFLKRVNDTYGHAAGDRYIKHAANTIKRSFGIEGTCYRTGGDEFTVVIAGEHLDERVEECTRLFYLSLDEQSAAREGDVVLSMALGVARASEAEPHTLSAAQKLADKRMYANKRAMKAERTE